MKFRSSIPLALVLAIGACAPETRDAGETAAQEKASPTDAGGLIAALAANYQEHYNLGHADMVADLYTEDAIVQTAASEVAVGRAAIAAVAQRFMTAMSPTLTINPIEQMVSGDWVVDRGGFTNVVTPAGGEAMTLSGNYMSLSRRVGDGLSLHRLAVNFDERFPVPAPQRAESEAMTDGPMSELIATYQELYNAHDAAGVAAVWTDDAVAMFAERPAVAGRAEIEARIAEVMANYDPQLTIIDAETLMLDEGTALDRGALVIETTMDGQSVTRHGTYLVLNKQADDGTWKLHWGISNLEPMGMM